MNKEFILKRNQMNEKVDNEDVFILEYYGIIIDKIEVKEIVHIYSTKNYINIRDIRERVRTVWMSIKELKSVLPENFVETKKGRIVNLNKVDGYYFNRVNRFKSLDQLKLNVRGIILVVSRRNKKNFVKTFLPLLEEQCKNNQPQI